MEWSNKEVTDFVGGFLAMSWGFFALGIVIWTAWREWWDDHRGRWLTQRVKLKLTLLVLMIVLVIWGGCMMILYQDAEEVGRRKVLAIALSFWAFFAFFIGDTARRIWKIGCKRVEDEMGALWDSTQIGMAGFLLLFISVMLGTTRDEWWPWSKKKDKPEEATAEHFETDPEGVARAPVELENSFSIAGAYREAQRIWEGEEDGPLGPEPVTRINYVSTTATAPLPDTTRRRVPRPGGGHDWVSFTDENGDPVDIGEAIVERHGDSITAWMPDGAIHSVRVGTEDPMRPTWWEYGHSSSPRDMSELFEWQNKHCPRCPDFVFGSPTERKAKQALGCYRAKCSYYTHWLRKKKKEALRNPKSEPVRVIRFKRRGDEAEM
jgi:hypothetical protein